MANLGTFKKSLIRSPHVTLILASTVDGFIASSRTESTQERRSFGLGSETDFHHMRELVSESEAVFVGAHSMLNERGAFRVAHLRANGDEPLWIVFSRSINRDFRHAFWRQTGIPRLIFKCEDFVRDSPVPLIFDNIPELNETQAAEGNLASLMHFLLSQGVKKISLLGGSRLAAMFFNAGLIHEVALTVCPVLMGAGHGGFQPVGITCGLNKKVKLKLLSVEQKSSEMYLRYKVEN